MRSNREIQPRHRHVFVRGKISPNDGEFCRVGFFAILRWRGDGPYVIGRAYPDPFDIYDLMSEPECRGSNGIVDLLALLADVGPGGQAV